jgi:hypothetical protein
MLEPPTDGFKTLRCGVLRLLVLADKRDTAGCHLNKHTNMEKHRAPPRTRQETFEYNNGEGRYRLERCTQNQ